MWLPPSNTPATLAVSKFVSFNPPQTPPRTNSPAFENDDRTTKTSTANLRHPPSNFCAKPACPMNRAQVRRLLYGRGKTEPQESSGGSSAYVSSALRRPPSSQV